MEMVCNGVRIAYEVTGEGSPVTMIHGLTATSKVWRNQVAPLSGSHRVLAYDLRGHGESAKPADGSFSFDSHVADLLDLLDGLGIAQTALVGWSMGASVATAFAAAHPGRVSRLVLIGGTPMLVGKPDFPYAMPPEQQAAIVGAAQQDYNGFAKAFGQMMLPEEHEQMLEGWVHGMAMQAGAETFLAVMEQAAPFDLRPTIARVAAPTLVLHGERDALCPLPAGQYFAEHIPGARFQVFAGVGHAPFLTRTDEVNALLAGFLSV